jgi:hypothetical protein
MAIPKKPTQTTDVDNFIGGAKATRADQTPVTPSGTATDKKMFSARIDPLTIKKIRMHAAKEDKTKEDVVQEALDLYFADKEIHV